DGHGSALHELDARHFSTVTLAVAGSEDARVTTGTRREAGPDLLEQLVCHVALAHVPSGHATIVQRTGLRLRYELLYERTEFLGLGLGGLYHFVLDKRTGQSAHQGELLLAGAPELPSALAMPH